MPLHVVQQQLHNSLPLRVHLPSFHLLGLYLVSGEVGGVDDRAGHPLEGGFKGFAALGDGVLALADWRQEELDCYVF